MRNENPGRRYSDCRASELQNVQMMCARASVHFDLLVYLSYHFFYVEYNDSFEVGSIFEKSLQLPQWGYSWPARLICIVFVKSLILHS